MKDTIPRNGYTFGMTFEGFLFGRHTERVTDIVSQEKIRDESPDYTAVSEHGVELSRERAKEIKNMLDNAPRGTILFFGGASEEGRTKSTTDIYGDTLEKLYEKNEEVRVFSRKRIDMLRETSGADTNIVRLLASEIQAHPDKKFAILYPLFMKEFSLRPSIRSTEPPHHITEYAMVLQPDGRVEHEAVEALLASDGNVVKEDGSIIEGPTAMDFVENYMRGVKRLRDFTEKYAPERPIIVGFVSHGLILDALLTYLANDGKPYVDGFKKIDGKMMQSSELAKVEIKEGKAIFEYRNKRFDIPDTILQRLSA